MIDPSALNETAVEILSIAFNGAESVLANQGETSDRDYALACIAAAAKLCQKGNKDLDFGASLHSGLLNLLVKNYEELHGAIRSRETRTVPGISETIRDT